MSRKKALRQHGRSTITVIRASLSVARDHAVAAGRLQLGAKRRRLCAAGPGPDAHAIEGAATAHFGLLDRRFQATDHRAVFALESLPGTHRVSLALLRRDLDHKAGGCRRR